jgi:tetratricopeptide (TPR) repeat protein
VKDPYIVMPVRRNGTRAASRRRRRLRGLFCCCAALACTACQTTATRDVEISSMPIDEARQVAVDFASADFVPPPRSTNDLRSRLESGRTVPADCPEQIAERQENFETLRGEANSIPMARGMGREMERKLRGNVVRVGYEAENLMSIGRFDLAIDLLEDALRPFNGPYRYQSFPITQGEIESRLARFHARLGNLDRARKHKASLDRLWRAGRAREYLGLYQWKSQMSSTNAELAFAAGDLAAAEQHYRKAVRASKESRAIYGYLNEADMRAGLARTLVLQGRLSEAEAASREALDSLGISRRGGSTFASGLEARNAAPVVVLAEVYLEQGRPEDAEFVARVAINMLEHDCASPASLGLTSARRTLVQVLAEQGKWTKLLQEIGKARDALRDHPDLFRREFGESLARFEAEIQAGDAQAAPALLESARARLIETDPDDAYAIAEIDALVALSHVRRNQPDEALPMFARAVPALLRPQADAPSAPGAAIGSSTGTCERCTGSSRRGTGMPTESTRWRRCSGSRRSAATRRSGVR